MLSSLKGRLYLLIFALLVPCYIFLFLGFIYSASTAEDELKKLAYSVSQDALFKQQSIIESAHQFLVNLSFSDELQQPDSAQCERYVSAISRLKTEYVNIGVPNANGKLTCNATPLANVVDVSDRPYIQKAIQQKLFSASDVQTDRATDSKTINFAYPVMSFVSPKRVIGAAVVVVSLEWWDRFIENLTLPEGSVAYMFDAHGQLIGHKYKDVGFSPYMNFEQGIVHEGNDGRRRFFFKSVVDAKTVSEFTFVVGISAENSLLAIEHYYLILTIVFSAIVFIAVMGSRYFFGKNILQPFASLLKLVEQVDQNQPLNSAISTGIREIDQLETQFVSMANRKQLAEREIIRQARLDYLTNVENRLAFDRYISELFSQVSPTDTVALIYLDIDDYKDINDNYGHDTGDNILQVIANRLKSICDDKGRVFRLGGDEFCIVLVGDEWSKDIDRFCCSITENLSHPIPIEFTQIKLTTSVGYAVYPDDAADRFELTAAADHAMYWAKNSGNNVVRRFDEHLKNEQKDRKELSDDLAYAISRDELFLVYQPIVNQDKVVQKFEALLRWQHPERGLINPLQFISLAEETGQINEIGLWILEQVKSVLPKLKASYGEQVQVSINVSPKQFIYSSDDQPDIITALLDYAADETGFGSQSIIIEITENLLMDSDEETRSLLASLRDVGYQLALDDFGTGYSSLSYILNYKIDYLKIDKSFIDSINADEPNSICEAMINMAHKLGVSVVSEGVETESQTNELMKMGNDFFQGYLFSKPKKLEELIG